MLCIYLIQHWFNLDSFACEEALYDITRLRHFAGIDLGCCRTGYHDAAQISSPRPTYTTNIPCLICCMVMSIALNGNSAYASQKDLMIHSNAPRPTTSPTVAPVRLAARSMKSSAARTVTSQR
jgi:hypothetical protein